MKLQGLCLLTLFIRFAYNLGINFSYQRASCAIEETNWLISQSWILLAKSYNFFQSPFQLPPINSIYLYFRDTRYLHSETNLIE